MLLANINQFVDYGHNKQTLSLAVRPGQCQTLDGVSIQIFTVLCRHNKQGTSGFGIQVILPISKGRMVKYFCNNTDIRSTWDHVVSAFWQRYPNPFSTHVLTEDVVYREVTEDHRLLSRRLLMKTNRLPRWAERFFPGGMSRSVYIIEDSIVDPVNRSLTTYTWNLNHTTLMSVEERCIFQDSVQQPSTTQLKREAWISSSVFGFSRPIQEFGLARFKSNQVKAMKGLEYALSNLQGIGIRLNVVDLVGLLCRTKRQTAKQKIPREPTAGGEGNVKTSLTVTGEAPQRLLRDTVKDASEKARETAKNLASAAAVPQKPQQYV